MTMTILDSPSSGGKNRLSTIIFCLEELSSRESK